jgi:hypothetical protein
MQIVNRLRVFRQGAKEGHPREHTPRIGDTRASGLVRRVLDHRSLCAMNPEGENRRHRAGNPADPR